MSSPRRRFPFHFTIATALLAGAALALGGCGNDSGNPTHDGSAAGGAGGHGDGGPVDAPVGTDGGDGGPTDAPVGMPKKLVILHTNDIHSHLMGFAPETDYTPGDTTDQDGTVGGMARLATAIGTAKAQAAAGGTPVLLLDAGDFMMGTLFELLATADPPELKFMTALGYDVTTIGNHELDYTPKGLAAILQAATTMREPSGGSDGGSADGGSDGGADGGGSDGGGVVSRAIVPIVASNMNFSATDTGDDELQAFFGPGKPIQKKLIKTVGGLKVGFFGLLGSDAVTVTPQSKPLTFDPIATAAAAMVADLRNNDKVDLVIALSHSGIDSTGNGEDATLAQTVPGIDIIISGHTHDKLDQPKVVQANADAGTGQTIIVTAGSYTQFLGKLEISVWPPATPGGRASIAIDKYTLQSIDDTVMGDTATQMGVDQYIAGVDTALAPAGLTYKTVVAGTGVDLPLPAYMEAPVGDLVTDAYLKLTSQLAAATSTTPPDIAVEANGQLRAAIAKGKTGKIWFEDLFRVLPLGIGPIDQRPGFPLVSFYLNAKDIKSGLELGGAPEVASDQYFLQVAGLKVQYDMSKPVFGRVTSLKLVKPTGDEVTMNPADTATCYKVVATNYVAGLLGVVSTFTHGQASVEAKDADCVTKIDPTTRFVDADPATTGVQELKNYQTLLKYVLALPGGTVPAAYGAAQGRITKQ